VNGRIERVRVTRLLGILAVAVVIALSAVASAQAGISREFQVFKYCPYENPAVSSCVYSTTTGGYFKLGNKTVPINKTVVLQGGLQRTTEALVPASNGETLSKTQLQVPGGLIGIELLPPLTEVNTTAELAGTVDVSINNTASRKGTAVSVPLKAHLENPLLLNECYVGTDSEPFTPHLTTGTTNPPSGEPLEGSPGTLSMVGDGKINVFSGTKLVDNTFSVPGASGCAGLLALVVDPSVDLIVGIPSGPGANAAVMEGSLEQAGANIVKTQLALPEIGRCVKVTPVKEGGKLVYHGLYNDAGCTFEVPQLVGKYEWKPGAVAKPFSGAGKAMTLQTVGGKKVSCLESSASGEYTGLRSATIALTLTGCKNASTKEACHSSGAAEGTIALGTLSATLGFISDKVTSNGPVAKLGWDLQKGGTFAAATCGSSSEALNVTGSVIATISAVDKMVPSYSLAPKAKLGKQEPEAFEEEPNDTLTASLGSGSAEAAGLNGSVKITNGEKLEFKGLSE
jgi:hypothetical protein